MPSASAQAESEVSLPRKHFLSRQALYLDSVPGKYSRRDVEAKQEREEDNRVFKQVAVETAVEFWDILEGRILYIYCPPLVGLVGFVGGGGWGGGGGNGVLFGFGGGVVVGYFQDSLGQWFSTVLML